MATTRPSRPALAGATGVLALAAASAVAAPTELVPSLDLRALATDNSGLVDAASRRADLVGDLDASLRVRERGARLTATGDLGVDLIGYARHTQPDRVLPRGKLDFTAILAERAFYLDGGIEATRERADPLAAQAGGASTANTVSTVALRASPYLAVDVSPELSATVRTDWVVTRSQGDSASGLAAPNGSTWQRELARVVRKPVPFGLSVEAAHEETRYQDSSSPTLRSDEARALAQYAFDPEFIAGVVGGRDHAVYGTVAQDEPRYGLTAQWRPSPRTSFDADVEHRYFGIGWDVRLRHRVPLAIVDLQVERAPSAGPASFAVAGRPADPVALLDALMSSRIPNPVDRDKAVDTLVAQQALPGDFAQPTQVISESAQLATRATLNLMATGVRNTIVASAFYAKSQALAGAATPAATSFDSRQWGGSLGVYHRLTPLWSTGVELGWSELQALGARAGESSRQLTGTWSLSGRLGPGTSVTCGLRHLAARSRLDAPEADTRVQENQAFAGVRMQY